MTSQHFGSFSDPPRGESPIFLVIRLIHCRHKIRDPYPQAFGVIYERILSWRKAIFYNFEPPPPSSSFLLLRPWYCLHKIFDPSPLRPQPHLWTNFMLRSKTSFHLSRFSFGNWNNVGHNRSYITKSRSIFFDDKSFLNPERELS